MNQAVVFENFIELLAALKNDHNVTSPLYRFLKSAARLKVEDVYRTKPEAISFEPFGEIVFPYHSMGAVDTTHLFDIDELILFSFYWVNRNRYKNVLDLGANIGLHTIVLNRCGYNVKSYEPDPVHFTRLEENLNKNRCTSERFNTAISSKSDRAEFVRVLGNTTGNHLKGAKTNPYGRLETIEVTTVSFKDIAGGAELAKMDIEGHEKDVILSTSADDWKHLDLLLEVGNETNAREIFRHASDLGLHLFSQKTGWKRAQNEFEVPWSYKEGSLFITKKDEMPWG